MINLLYRYLQKINLPNPELIQSCEIADNLLSKGVATLYQAIEYIHLLPYCRISDSTNYHLVLKEQRGTCTPKHALIAGLASSLHIPLHLKAGIILMNANNAPKIAPVLKKYQLNEIIEAHTYLEYEHHQLDITFPEKTNFKMTFPLLKERNLTLHDLSEIKMAWHKEAMKEFLLTQHLPYDLDQIWEIREQCVQALSTEIT